MTEGFVDVFQWIEYGTRQGWVTEACATHDGIPSTDEEDAEWAEGYDPCQHVLRLWPDAPRGGVEMTEDACDLCDSPGELEEVVAEEMTHDHPGEVLRLCAACAWDGF